ncbi:hypothetical protein [Bacillus taeanensis]|uniref:MobA-like NTP transferase domain-containing protein n=1 Tax=Bacillus taeanensis TaxID=273032 RepID=A0A366XXA4_9BACI|nr:hypothetical protein [Bacillus taeanensis]RBW69785.1 hypothetical protein DS031_09640 [Bacillus taeanensis]
MSELSAYVYSHCFKQKPRLFIFGAGRDAVTLAKFSSQIGFAASFFQGGMRPPILFSSLFFPLIMKLERDRGARELLKQNVQTDGLTIEFNRGRDCYEIDTKEEYEWIKEVEKI